MRDARPVGLGHGMLFCLHAAAGVLGIILLAAFAVAAPLAHAAEDSTAPGPNIALGKTYTFDITPDLKSCTDPGDATQLTNGHDDPECSASNKSAVGWKKRRWRGWDPKNPERILKFSAAEITIDLEKVEPIAGVSFRTCRGRARTFWPSAILILVSDDGKNFYNAGELIALSYREGIIPPPSPPPSCTHAFRTRHLKTRGRYVRFVVRGPSYIVCDEIEVYRGDDSLLNEPRVGEPVLDVKPVLLKGDTERGVRQRMLRDIADVRERVTDSVLAADEKERLAHSLDALADRAAKFSVPDDPEFRAIFPMNPVHAESYALNAPVLRSKGFKELTVWHQCRYDPLQPLDAPSQDTVEELPPLAIMPGQYQARALNLTNPTDEIETVRISFAGLPESPTPSWVEPHEVLFTDSLDREILGAALEPLKPGDGAYALTIPAGMTKQVWFRFHPTTVAPGDYQGSVVLQGNNVKHSVSLRVHVSKLRFPEQVRLATHVWDYAFGLGPYGGRPYRGITMSNIRPAIQNMKEHFVNVTWATKRVMPVPTAEYFNDKDELVKPLGWVALDHWIKLWAAPPKPRYYIVYLGVPKGLTTKAYAGAGMGTPKFDARVRAWMAALRQHVVEAGLIKPEQLGVLIMDQYRTDGQAEHVLASARPIKAGYPEIQIFETVCQKQPDQSKVQELYELIDIFCVQLGYYDPDTETAKEFYAGHVARRGAKLWFYLNNAIDYADPYSHFRMLPWRSWTRGMTGTGFWGYCDVGLASWSRGEGSWNRYVTGVTRHYSPVFLGRRTVHDTKHWEAFREGLQDYECLALLRDRIEELKTQGRFDAEAEQAERVLLEVPRTIEDATDDSIWGRWSKPKDRTLADGAMTQILTILEALSEK